MRDNLAHCPHVMRDIDYVVHQMGTEFVLHGFTAAQREVIGFLLSKMLRFGFTLSNLKLESNKNVNTSDAMDFMLTNKSLWDA